MDEICCKHSVRRNLGGPYLVVLLCVIGTNNSCSDLCSDFSNGFDRRALSKLNFVNTHDKEGCVVMFYEVEDIIITIGGGAVEAAFPTLNGVGGIGNSIAFYNASRPGGFIDKTTGGVLRRLKPSLDAMARLGGNPLGDAGAAPARRDPLVLDLNRDGKVGLKNAAYFDLNANGFHEFTRWIDKTDAFLVLDKNFNGKADDGSELFGDAMTLPDGSLALTGFDALRAYDSNGDGKIDASDEIYASLKVLTGEGKMSGLADAGVKSLNVASEAVNENSPPALSQSDLANRSAA